MTKKIIYIIYTLILWGTTLGFAQGDKGNGGDQTTATRLLQAGDKFYDQRLYTASMKSYLEGLRIAEHQGYNELTARFYNGMGNLYSTQGDYQMGLYFYRKALRSSRKTGQKTLQNAVLNNLVGASCFVGQADSGMVFLQQMEANVEHNSGYRYNILMGRGLVAKSQDQPAAAASYYIQARQYAIRTGMDSSFVDNTNSCLAQLYMDTHRLDSAILLLKKNEEWARRTNHDEFLAETMHLLAQAYDAQGDATRASTCRMEYANLMEKLHYGDELNAMKGLNYDLLDKYWETGVTMKHNVNLSGATDRASYFASLSYFDQDGNLGNLDYNRWNYRAGVDVKVSQWLGANLSVSGDYGKKNTPYIKVGGTSNEKDYNILLTRPRYIPEYVNGLPIAAYGISNTQVDDDQNYSFSELRNNGDYSRTMNSNINIQGSINYDFGWSKILKGLKLRFSYSKSINTDKTNQYGSEYKVYTMQTRPGSGSHLYTPVEGQDYSQFITEANLLPHTIANGDPSQLNRSMTRTDNYQMNFTASYNRDFGEHSIGALFSIEKSEAESEYLYAMVSDPYPFTTGQSNSAEGETKVITFTRSESGTLSYIGRINYAYANKYLAEFLIRSDASTKFAPVNYWGVFPSFSAGWVMSEEKWFKEALPWVDFLKVRGSFGMTGRDNTAAWQWMQVYAQDANRGPVFGTGISNESENRITINKNNSAVNKDVHWDKVYKANFGLDFTVLDNRLSVTYDMYREWNRDMLMNISQAIEGTIGTQSAAVNLGEMDSWGYELSATWRDKIGKDFKYRIGLNTGYSDNKVLNMDFATDYIYRQIQRGGRTDIGLWGMQCIGMFRSFQDIEEYFDKYNITSYLGMSKDEVRPGMLIYKDVRGPQQEDGTYAGPDGVVDKDNDQVCLSNRNNPYSVTMNLGADYKGFSLTAQLSASWGGYSFVDASALKSGSGVDDLEFTNMPSFWNVDNMYSYQDIYDAAGNLVVAANRNGSLPNLAYQSVNAITSSFWRISGTRVKLSRLTLAYTIPSSLVKKIGIQSARVNVTGQNLLSFYNPYPDNFMDPMCSYGSYPTLRQFTVGVNLTF